MCKYVNVKIRKWAQQNVQFFGNMYYLNCNMSDSIEVNRCA